MAAPITDIPKGSWVLVTGANGFVASHIIREFLQRGYKVRGTVRDIAKSSWLIDDLFKSYAQTGDFKLVTVPELGAANAFDDAVKGMSAIIHVATVATFSPNPKEVIPPTVAAGTSILHAALKEPSVKSFVYTGSIVGAGACYPGVHFHADRNTWNDADVKLSWAPPPYDPRRRSKVYNASKTEAERAVFKFAEEKKPHFRVNSVPPAMIMGEPLNKKHLETPYSFIKVLSDGNVDFLAGVPSILHVDVKDVALLHVAAVLDPEVNDARLQAWGDRSSWNDLLTFFRKTYPERKWVDDFPDVPFLTMTTDMTQQLRLMKKWGNQEGFKTLEETVVDNMKNIIAWGL